MLLFVMNMIYDVLTRAAAAGGTKKLRRLGGAQSY
jgi:hypothetical protein